MTKLEPHVSLICKRINGEIFNKSHSNNYLFSKLEGRIFRGITVHMYLKKHGEKQQLVHASSQPLRDPAVDSVAAVIVAYELSPTYSELQSHLDTITCYKPVCINDCSC